MYDPSISYEEKVALSEMLGRLTAEALNAGAGESPCDITSYEVPGCPEEPESSVEVLVYRPKTLEDRKARCMFYVLGGALTLVEPAIYPIDTLCVRYNCVAVTVKYRKSFDAQYPAAINDLHAGYEWMIDNAEEIGIDPENVILHGVSTGGHLALAVAFRLKRYGYSPKGIVAVVPQTDDREAEGHSIYNGAWDSITQHHALAQWLGPNFGSSRIGPEALANHATIEDCIGYPPTFIHTVELDPDRQFNREFYGKLLEANTYAEYHVWGGAHHACGIWNGNALGGVINEYSARVKVVIDGNIEDCWNYDLRRDWLREE